MYQKTHDYILTWTPKGQLCAAICKVKIFHEKKYLGVDRFIIFVSEMPNNPGMSVTNGFEQIAMEIIERDFLEIVARNFVGTNFTWVEHWAKDPKLKLEETFDTVTLTWRDRRLALPQWKRVSWYTLSRILEIEGEFKDT
jgi:hypothetical protein